MAGKPLDPDQVTLLCPVGIFSTPQDGEKGQLPFWAWVLLFWNPYLFLIGLFAGRPWKGLGFGRPKEPPNRFLPVFELPGLRALFLGRPSDEIAGGLYG